MDTIGNKHREEEFTIFCVHEKRVNSDRVGDKTLTNNLNCRDGAKHFIGTIMFVFAWCNGKKVARMYDQKINLRQLNHVTTISKICQAFKLYWREK